MMSARRCSILLHETEQKKQTDGFFPAFVFSFFSFCFGEMATVDQEVPEELANHLRTVLERRNCKGAQTQTKDSSSTIELGSLGESESEELRGVLKRLETEG